MNKAELIGRLGSDPRGGMVNGNTYSNISIATQEDYTDGNGQRRQRTTWHRIVCWGRIAEFANQYLSKGRLVFVEGRINHRSYTDMDGVVRTVTEIIANRIKALDPKPVHGNEPPSNAWQGDVYVDNEQQPIIQ